MAQIIDGKAIARQIRETLKKEIQDLRAKQGITPGLAVILVGDDPGSQVYVRMKDRACREVGINALSEKYPETLTETDLLARIRTLNADPTVHGILVQLPLPAQIRSMKILETIDPAKDADGFHPYNVGLLAIGAPAPRPCTPWGIMELLRHAGSDPSGQHAVVVGRSNIVGKPIANMLLAANATVTICHSHTRNLAQVCASADILIAAVGQPKMIRASWVKPGAVVIDVGMNRLPDGGLFGDVDFQEVQQKTAAITPVPGGVGPMTIAMLLSNTVAAAKLTYGPHT